MNTKAVIHEMVATPAVEEVEARANDEAVADVVFREIQDVSWGAMESPVHWALWNWRP